MAAGMATLKVAEGLSLKDRIKGASPPARKVTAHFTDLSNVRYTSPSPPAPSPDALNLSTSDALDHEHEKLHVEIVEAIDSFKKVRGKWEQFSKELVKFHQYQEKMAEVSDHFLEVFAELAESTKNAVHSVGDLGDGLERVVEGFRVAEHARRTALDTFKTELLVGVAEYIDRYKAEASLLEKEFSVEDKKMDAVVKKARKRVKEVTKKKGAALNSAITAQLKAQNSAKKEQALASSRQEAEEASRNYEVVMNEWLSQRRSFLRKTVVNRRKEMCHLLTQCERVLKAQTEYYESAASSLEDPTATLTSLSATSETLPRVIARLCEARMLDDSTVSAMETPEEENATPSVGPLAASTMARIDDVEDVCRREAALTVQAWWRGVLARLRLGRAQQIVRRAFEPRKGKREVVVPGSFPYFEDPYSDANMLATITAIDLQLLMRKLTQPGVDAAELRELVLTTHSNFIGADALLQFVLLRFNAAHEPGVDEATEQRYTTVTRPTVQIKCVEFLEQWLRVMFDDFRRWDTHHRLVTFCERVATDPSYTEAVKIAVAQLLGSYTALKRSYVTDTAAAYTAVSMSGAPTSLIITTDNPMSLAPDQLHPLEVARQLTILDFSIFKRVHPRELLKQAWCKDRCKQRAPHVLGVIERFNRTAAWGSTEVLRCNAPEDRARTICMLLDVANGCVVLQNYSALMAILTSLQAAAVSRLKYTWELVPDEYMAIFKDLKDFMSMSYNYRTYREKLRKVKPPAVPYLGCILQDLTFIDDGNESRVGAGGQLINIEKERMTYNVIKEILALRRGQYALHPVATISHYLLGSYVWSADRQYATSLVVEPRSMKPPKSKPRQIAYVTPEGSERPEFDVGKNAAFLDDLMLRMEKRGYKAGQYIVTVGEPGKCMYFISSGVCNIELPDGRCFPCNQGSFFGEIALFLDKPRTASVKAHTDVEAYILSKTVCDQVLSEYPEIYAQFAKLGEERLKADASAAKPGVPKWLQKIAGQVG